MLKGQRIKKSRACYFYVVGRVVGARLQSPVKVGITMNLEDRITTLQTGCPFEIDLFGSICCGDRDYALTVERAFSAKFEKARIRGEWYRITPIAAIDGCAAIYGEIVASCGFASITARRILARGAPVISRQWYGDNKMTQDLVACPPSRI